jgi:putative DNA primase/helicase
LGTDHAIWRRIRVIDFPTTFISETEYEKLEKKDGYGIAEPKMDDILTEIADEFGLMLIEYYKKYTEDGYILREPEEIRRASDKYRRESDMVMEFITERCERGDSCRIFAGEMYTYFKDYVQENGMRLMYKQRVFSERVSEVIGIEYSRIHIGEQFKNGWYGIGMRGDQSDELV